MRLVEQPELEPATRERVIKICGITSTADAQDAVEAGASAIGLNFYPISARYIDLEQAREIASTLPHGLLCVGVFVNPTPDQILR